MKTWIKFFAILLAATAFGQSFKVEAELSKIQKDSLYSIFVPNNIRSFAKTDLSDFRIWDSNGNQVPYFVEPTHESINSTVSNFNEFSIISSSRKADTSSSHIFNNPKKSIEQVVLLLANYQGFKSYKLVGSNDQEKWFGIVNNGQLTQLNHPTHVSVYKVINFPICSYSYLKIVFDDKRSLPINLLKVGETISSKTEAILMENIPAERINISNDGKVTKIHVRFERPEVIDYIRMNISAPNLYSRKARIYKTQERELKHKTELFEQELNRFYIRSDQSLKFSTPIYSEKEFFIEIENNDNPKLQIDELQFLQAPIYIIASLRKGETYKVTAGNERFKAPKYDISYVAIDLLSKLPKAEIHSVKYLETVKKSEPKVSFWQQTWFMWICIGIAALVILYFVFNLLKELNTKKA